MSRKSETPLQSSLDAIDHMRRRTQALGWLVVAGSVAAYAHLAYVQRTSDSLERVLNASVLALTSLIAWVSFAIILIMIRMTKRILRAIDLALRESPYDDGGGSADRPAAGLARRPAGPI